MSDNEYERFEVTDFDLDNEFNPNRPRRRLTKNQQIYGIWADDDSDNESPDEFSRRRGGGRSKPKDYSAPVSFIAGGIHQVGKKDKDKEAERTSLDDQITDEDDEDDARPSFVHKQATLMDAANEEDSSENDSFDEEVPPKPSGSGSGQQRSSFVHKSHIPSSKNVGAWEKHTRGIGAKLLLQMGYKPGMGLGKDLQGISHPVEAHIRKGRGAIGAYGPEKSASVPGKELKPKEDDDIKEAKEFKEKLNKWKKAGDTHVEKPKRYYYKSVEEVIERGKKSSSLLSAKLSKKLGNVPVIDMTGPERRVLSGYHALGQSRMQDEDLYELEVASSTTSKKAATEFALPELMHNLQLIVNMCEQEIITLDKAEHEANERQAALEHELKNLEEIANLEGNHISTLEQALILVEELSNNDNTKLTLERAEQIFVTLKHDFASEYKEFALGDLAAGVIAPLVKISLTEWKPLAQPTENVELIKKWRTILYEQNNDVSGQSESRNVFDPYSSLIWAGVIPSFRACAEEWDPKEHQTMAALLDCWAPLFPAWILDSVLEQIVLPRLCAGVREWDPLTDRVPIHIWILPWNTILGHKMEEFIFPTIREKLGAALQSWMPHDRSACAMLKPWKNAFSNVEMELFLLQHIVPKLQMVLNTFIVSPIHQELEPWNQVMEWNELLPNMHMADLLDKYFFPKWMQVLVMWLNQSPDYSEISRWYTGWKSMFSEDLLREPSIKEHLRRALEVMQRATDNLLSNNINSGISQTQAMPPPPPPPSLQPPPSLMDLQIAPPVQLEFKELVSQKCAERGILFAPMPGRRELGKQVYRVGKLFCYIDRNVCMLSDSSFMNWLPTSVQQLLECAATGVV